jgi:hypothetical protein
VTAGQSYKTSINRVQDAALKARLESIVDDIVEASNDFAQAMTAGQVTGIATHVAVGAVTAPELQAVYMYRFAKLESAGRPIYDELLAAAPNDQCPLCGHRQATTLDHFLPKAAYPSLVVAPLNLVPACKDCNKDKLDAVPAAEAEVTLHPYFDNVDDGRWLYAEVLHTHPASFAFYPHAPDGWDPLLAARLVHHFSSFRLGRLYSAQAAVELTNIRFHLQGLHDDGGAPAVAAHLQEQADSRHHAHLNSWQTALYQAMTESAWFCDGGFAA